MKKNWLTYTLAAITVTLGLVFSAGNISSAKPSHPADIVGVWEVDAEAPYRPHLFTFHADGTMTTTNPSNVQEDPADPTGGTNDSLGMGVWEVVHSGNDRVIIGTFEQLNAFVNTHTEAPKLSVSFKVRLEGSDVFDGPAVASLGGHSEDSHLHGDRVKIDQTAVDSLSFTP